MNDDSEFGEESIHHNGHFGLRTSKTEYLIRCIDCPYGWVVRGPLSEGASIARRAVAHHAVEFHTCTYKASPK